MVNALAPSRMCAGSVGYPGIAAVEARRERITSIKVLLKKVICFNL